MGISIIPTGYIFVKKGGAILTDSELLEKVKTGLALTGNYHDEMLKIYIAEVKYFMKDAGVSEETLKQNFVLGAIIRGVSDLWNFGSGSADFSPYFMQRVTQLAYTEDSSNENV